MNPTPSIEIENLMSRMQKEDKRKRNYVKTIFIVYLLFSVFLAVLLLINPDPDLDLADRISGLFYIAAFLFGSWYFRREYKMYKNMDYTLPLMQLLEKTEKRYRFFNRKWLPISIIVVLIEIGEIIPYINGFMVWNEEVIHRLFIMQALFLCALTVGASIGYIIWKKRTYAIWKDAKTLLSELKN